MASRSECCGAARRAACARARFPRASNSPLFTAGRTFFPPTRRLVVQAIIEDEKVGLDQLEEALNAFTEIVQSVDFCSMSKVSGR